MNTSSIVLPRPMPHIPIRPEWLVLQREDALEPVMPIVDSHHHLWQFPEKSYRATDFLADIGGGHRVVSTVFF